MGAHQRLVLSTRMGCVRAVMGLLLFGVSYYLLPVDAIHCRDTCGQGQTWDYTTMGQLSRYALSAWQYEMNAQPQFSSSVVLDTILLVA